MESFITIASFVVFLVIFLWIGALAARVSDHTETDYLLGNRSFGKVVIGLSAGATGNSGWIMVGSVGMAYMMGISSLLMPIAYFLGDLIFWNFFPHKINQISLDLDLQTVPEFLGSSARSKQGKRIVTLIVALITIVFIGAYIAGQFSAAAKTLDVFFGVDIRLGTFIAAGSILIYCVTGGLRASIWTDVVQAFIVLFVSVGMLAVALIAGGGISNIVATLHDIDPQLTNFTAGFTSWTLLAYVVGYFFLGFGFNISQPQILVRLLASRSPEDAKQAKWVYLSYVYLTWVAMILFGIIVRALIPAIDDPEQALPFYAMQNFNPILVGVVLAGVFSVISSTADSQLLVCSSTLARDVSPPFYHKMSRRHGLKYEQSMTSIVGILAAIATLNISATVFSLMLFGAGAVAGSLGPAMLIVITKRRTNAWALSAMMIAGMMTTIVWRLIGYSNTLYEVFPGFVVALVVHEVLMKFAFQHKNYDIDR